MKLLIKNGRVIDPSQKIDEVCDVSVEDGRIREIARNRKPGGSQNKKKNSDDEAETVDASGLLVLPGLIDMHVHLREPGFANKETIRTGTEAAVRGGITSVCCMPNTNPSNDTAVVTEYIMKKALHEGACSVFPIGAISKGQKGEELAELSKMYEAGCVAFSDDGMPVSDSLLMRRALEYSRVIGVPIISHCEDMSLAAGGVMNEGLLSVTMGLRGIPAQAEEIMAARDIMLAELTGGRLHLAHISTAGTVELVRAAKKRGIADITAETCPHYFSITEEAVRGYNTHAKVNPPLRTQKDVEAIRQGLSDGTIDAIATDHAPHHRDEKLAEFDSAPSGISGLETSLGLSMRLVDEGVLDLPGLISKMTFVPARILGLSRGTLSPGSDADITIVATGRPYEVRAADFRSKGKNTPFEGFVLNAYAVRTILNGRTAYEAD